MVTINNSQPPAQVNNSSNAGLIILAVVILAAVIGGIWYFTTYGPIEIHPHQYGGPDHHPYRKGPGRCWQCGR
ncbi:MAG: hypothetical protein NVV72_02470 [Asticcacaulis sp.]|nr:hypothetical protein [Asticcacaulis sp.]